MVAEWAEWALLPSWRGGELQLLGQRSWPGTCWNFFLAVPVSRSCGSIWGQIGTDLYARLVFSSDSAVPPGLPSFGALCYKM